MKVLVISLLLILSGCLTSQSDILFPDRTSIRRDGETTKEIRPDAILPERRRIKDRKTGSTDATIIPDVLHPGRYIIRKGVW